MHSRPSRSSCMQQTSVLYPCYICAIYLCYICAISLTVLWDTSSQHGHSWIFNNLNLYKRKLMWRLIDWRRGWVKAPYSVDDFSFFDCSSPCCFLLIDFHWTFTISYKIPTNCVYYHGILIRQWYAVGSSFCRGRLSSYRLRLFLYLHSFCSHARVFGKTLVHEFPISYSHAEWYLLVQRNDTIEMFEESPVKN